MHPPGIIFGAFFEIVNRIKAGPGAHEFKDTVHAEHGSEFGLHGSRLEASPDLEARVMNYNGRFYIEEAGSLTDLLQRSFAESLLDDDIQQLVHYSLRVLRHILAGHRYFCHAGLVHMYDHVC